jgi:hypothetical protein
MGLPRPPGAACFEALTQCVQVGGQITTCVDKARACITGSGSDAGVP